MPIVLGGPSSPCCNQSRGGWAMAHQDQVKDVTQDLLARPNEPVRDQGALMSLIFGIIGVVLLAWLLPPLAAAAPTVAFVPGFRARRRIRRSEALGGRAASRGMALGVFGMGA